ncbi:Gfo/Idh/MocA family oxidoreductase [Xanthocytophaga agilis]|uniref:Gfo/Idh/MocA family oxidoreductase n=1 Tax=Xanthocytophaga agilis TaxID=3048010 RepID=A0AAE3UF04_9BACT|nr:Gfo/Idh/MocA family oxidoreductase [Xanthocytophaga agilis]MDJ1500073.1 Gfo/Idh/MocA family oxidoreductase [Xanthocytophaga agilis]
MNTHSIKEKLKAAIFKFRFYFPIYRSKPSYTTGMQPNTIRWGILGCGKIARKFASDLQFVNNAQLIAVASRSQSTADAFAREFPAKYKHNSYEALVQNPEVDVIYIATPHVYHYEHTLLCLNHSKAVLCEKPFAINNHQVKEMIALAQDKKVFLMEALWTKFLPHFQKLNQIIAEGQIGEIRSVIADFGFLPPYNPEGRLFDPNLGGGSLLDIGIYPVFLALSLLGKPQSIQAIMTPAPTGVDEQCAITFVHDNHTISQLFSTLASFTGTEAVIHGSKGRIRLTSRFYATTATLQFYLDTPSSQKELFNQKIDGFGYQYEAQHVVDCLQKGLTESPIMTFADSILLIETLDEIRRMAGIKYHWDA